MEQKIIYMDNAATTMTKQEVVNEMLEYFTILYGNPSSIYEFAGKSRNAIENTRKIIADTLGADKEEIYFTSGGTESDNWAISAIARLYKNKGKHIISSKIEHPAILNKLKNLEDIGYSISYINVDENGIIKLDELENAIRTDTILITIMTANNEIGTIQPIQEIGKISKKHNVFFHTDAVQFYGQLPVDVNKNRIDLLSASGHKFNGPKGIGFLYVRNGVAIEPLIYGGGQESGMRSGTQNVPSIVGLGKAAQLSFETMSKKKEYLLGLREYMIKNILTKIPYSRINGSIKNRLPGNINVSFQFANASEIIAMLDMKGICASSGSACSSHSNKPSHVLKAMGLPDEISFSSVRFTLSTDNTINQIDFVINELVNIVKELRKDSVLFSECFANNQKSDIIT